ncbi:hypothetical protein GCM10010095_67380 [Streptomyces anthocyanicus]|uniref:hypothetical protein n=1 Tax=Streptomyces anthocyanicus TaxID=68174 RepID=UPI00167173BF|nr:hypothetical protein [Streptomyces anthocyanicus]GGL73112.1 hypothetical protein GCM10010095_67380 [Streptomyces anthocyanicus]
MRTRTKLTTVLASGTLAAGLLVGGASSASAGTAQTCYGGADDFSTTNKVWPAYPQWRTTSARCADVNVKATVGAYVQACFYQGAGEPHKCYAKRWLSQGVWDTAVTDVLNGKKFYLKFDRSTWGKVAY